MRAKAAGRKTVLLLLLVAYLALAVTYSVVIPAWESPDEVGHIAYIRHLRATGSLPRQGVDGVPNAQHPPLYYALAALVTLPVDTNDTTGARMPNPNFIWAGLGGSEPNAALHHSAETFPYGGQALFLHLVRLMSALMGLATIGLVAGIGWIVFPEQPDIGLLAAAFVAFTPQFLFITGSANNDNLLILTTTATCFLVLRGLARPEDMRGWLWVGVLLALALLTKSSAFVICLAAGVAIGFLAWQKRSWRFFLQAGVAVALPVVVGTGWWFWRNQMLYGDPLGWAVFREIDAANFRTTPFTANDFRHFLTTQMNSFWGLFGWMNVWAPAWFYTLVRVFSAMAFGGFLLFLARKFKSLTPRQQIAVWFLLALVVSQEIYLIFAVQRFNESWYQGRYLFPAIGPLFLLASIGFHQLLPRQSPRQIAVVLATGFLFAAMYMPIRVIAPAYPTIPQPKSVLWFLPNKTDYRFNEMIALKGYRLEPAADGNSLDVILYWQAFAAADFNYSAFVHLLDESGQVVTQKDHAPGEDVGYPPLVWSLGDIVEDHHVLPLPDALAAERLQIRVGLYNWESGQQATVRENGQELGGFVILNVK
ncbi:MAG: glycosyltransferase family 39 protein [Caldilineaceae bacterium]|nr:glycosyltransferase family 39 protein [Caldilineaceae bacterium]